MSDAERRESNKQRMRDLFTNLYEGAERDTDFWRQYYTDDTGLEMPHMELKMEGIDAVIAGIRTVPQNFTQWKHGTFEFHDCLDSDEIIWEADADAVFRHSGEPYRQRYVLFVSMSDGKIARYVEYVDM